MRKPAAALPRRKRFLRGKLFWQGKINLSTGNMIGIVGKDVQHDIDQHFQNIRIGKTGRLKASQLRGTQAAAPFERQPRSAKPMSNPPHPENRLANVTSPLQITLLTRSQAECFQQYGMK